MQLGHGRRLVSGRTVAAHGGGGRTEITITTLSAEMVRWRREVGRALPEDCRLAGGGGRW